MPQTPPPGSQLRDSVAPAATSGQNVDQNGLPRTAASQPCHPRTLHDKIECSQSVAARLDDVLGLGLLDPHAVTPYAVAKTSTAKRSIQLRCHPDHTEQERSADLLLGDQRPGLRAASASYQPQGAAMRQAERARRQSQRQYERIRADQKATHERRVGSALEKMLLGASRRPSAAVGRTRARDQARR